MIYSTLVTEIITGNVELKIKGRGKCGLSEKEMSIKNSWQILLGMLITAGQSSQHEIVDHVDIWRTSLPKSLGRNDLVTSEAPGRKWTGWDNSGGTASRHKTKTT